jgi:hypothetical protein
VRVEIKVEMPDNMFVKICILVVLMPFCLNVVVWRCWIIVFRAVVVVGQCGGVGRLLWM